MGDVSKITVRQQRMSSMTDIMDAEETEDWIERLSAAFAEWASRTSRVGGKQGGYSTLRTRTRESTP